MTIYVCTLCIVYGPKSPPKLNVSKLQASMNWTGGQLHRSARQGSLSKTQKQNFAKSRQLAIDRKTAFSNLHKCRQQTTNGNDQVEQAMVAERQTLLVRT